MQGNPRGFRQRTDFLARNLNLLGDSIELSEAPNLSTVADEVAFKPKAFGQIDHALVGYYDLLLRLQVELAVEDDCVVDAYGWLVEAELVLWL